ncbi:MAG: SUMF1/EgtB/PvdO family nonheme iron enzyme [Magnetococcales bacterium]|nr:SUMF1/EgtB/PvdO family nonheme iron enzyme [Magnetococcales bacterium]
MNPRPSNTLNRFVKPLAHLGMIVTLLTGLSAAHASLINEWEPLELDAGSARPALVIKAGQPWQDPSSEVKLLWIPAGCFQMGSPPRAEGRETDEGPMHDECVTGFWLGETEVTQGQWRRVMHNNPSRFRKGDNYPVENITREEVNEFLATLNSRARLNVQFRLPTEAEWEFACRDGGKRGVFPGGNEPSRFAWFAGNSNGTSQPVGLRAPNRLGLKDMSGNVWEWIQDKYQTNYNKPTAPGQASEPTSFYSIRGGGWQDEANSLRCSNRSFQSLSSRRPDLGVRLAASLKTKEKKSNTRQPDIKRMPF